MTPEAAFKKAIKLCGGPAATARALGMTRQSMHKSIHKSKQCPYGRAIRLEAATGGKVTRHELRPDLYPNEGSISHGVKEKGSQAQAA